MTRLSRTALAALGLALAAARPAAAQGITSPLRYIEEKQGVHVFAGYVFTDPSFTLNDSTTVELGPRSAPIIGANYQVRLGGPFSGTIGLGFIPAERKVFAAEANADSSAIRPIDTNRMATTPIIMVEAGMLFHLTGPRAYRGFAPHIGASVGYVRQIASDDEAEEGLAEGELYDFGPSVAVGLRAGTDVFVTRNVALRLGLNGRLWRDAVPIGFRAGGQGKIAEWNNASTAQVGAVIHF